ncbi:MAG: RNA ligase family protein [Xenococcaceae cyanobacterium MO_188.B19]|nr:RNA ligase family protein [Xenococcaceae cyanobacterium MO_188.B19]
MTRVKLTYPKIPDSKNCPLEKCLAFRKYDGTNLHWIWENELGWYGFGTRRNRYDLDEMGIAEFNLAHPGLEEAPNIFLRDLARPLETIFRTNQKYQSPEITVFTEFFGVNSFAGMHKQEDPKQLVLFDVETDRGIVMPEEFIADFSSLKIAEVIYRGKLTGKFIDDVRQGKYDVDEGVVCKGVSKTTNNLWMIKIKTNSYMQKLKQAFQDDWEAYWE